MNEALTQKIEALIDEAARGEEHFTASILCTLAAARIMCRDHSMALHVTKWREEFQKAMIGRNN